MPVVHRPRNRAAYTANYLLVPVSSVHVCAAVVQRGSEAVGKKAGQRSAMDDTNTAVVETAIEENV